MRDGATKQQRVQRSWQNAEQAARARFGWLLLAEAGFSCYLIARGLCAWCGFWPIRSERRMQAIKVMGTNRRGEQGGQRLFISGIQEGYSRRFYGAARRGAGSAGGCSDHGALGTAPGVGVGVADLCGPGGTLSVASGQSRTVGGSGLEPAPDSRTAGTEQGRRHQRFRLIRGNSKSPRTSRAQWQ